MKPAKIVFNELHTSDARKARSFYAELFGWAYEDLPSPEPYAFIKSESENIGGIASDSSSHWLTYVGVDDIKAATAKARSIGAKIEVDCKAFGDMGIATVLSDPTGARVALWESKARKK